MKKNAVLYSVGIASLLGILGADTAWAQTVETLDLDKAVKAALAHNELLKIKQLQVQENNEKVKDARVKQFPMGMVGTSYQYNFNVGQLTIPEGMFGSLPLGNANISLPLSDINYPLGKHHFFMGGGAVYQPLTQLPKIHTGIAVAQADADIADAESRKVTHQISSGVVKLYYGILIARKRQEEYVTKIEAANLKLYDVKSALLGGKTTTENEAGQHAVIADDEQELLKQQFQEQDYVADLKNLTGIVADSLILQDAAVDLPEEQPLSHYQQMADNNNVDMQMAALQIHKSELGIKAARQDNLPDVGLMAGYLYQTGNTIFPKNNPFIGASLQWNIQHLFSNRHIQAQRQLQQQQALENEAHIRKETHVAIEKAYRQLLQGRQLIAVAQKAALYREQDLKIQQDGLAAGLNTKIKVKEAASLLAKAQADLYAARLGYLIALSDLDTLTAAGK